MSIINFYNQVYIYRYVADLICQVAKLLFQMEGLKSNGPDPVGLC